MNSRIEHFEDFLNLFISFDKIIILKNDISTLINSNHHSYDIFYFYEDMLQIEFYKNQLKIVLDVGWYGEEDGHFKFIVLKDSFQTRPLFSVKIKEVIKLKDGFKKSLDKIVNIINNG